MLHTGSLKNQYFQNTLLGGKEGVTKRVGLLCVIGGLTLHRPLGPTCMCELLQNLKVATFYECNITLLYLVDKMSSLLFESLHDSRSMLGAGSSSRVELFPVFMGTRLWQDGADQHVFHGRSLSVHPR